MNTTIDHDCHRSPEDSCAVCDTEEEAPKCEECGGTGKVTYDDYPDGGVIKSGFTKKCICTYNDEDMDDDS